jgi:hypothetical protein
LGTGQASSHPATPSSAAGSASSAPAVNNTTSLGRALYTADRTQSPLTEELAARLRAVVRNGGHNQRVFMKVGDSISANAEFMGCFAYANFLEDYQPPQPYAWDNYISLDASSGLKATIPFFKDVAIDGTSSFNRVSIAARVGQDAAWALAGVPNSPVDQEAAVTQAAYAVVMYGSNDIICCGDVGTPVDQKVLPYYSNLLALVDHLLDLGIVPVLTTMPPRTDDPGYPLIVPVFTAAARAIAQGRRIPLIDWNREMLALGPASSFGLLADGVHPTSAGYNATCHLAPSDLLMGMNLRNRATLEALDRLRQVVTGGAASLDTVVPRQAGTGTAQDPLLVGTLPFTDLRNTADAPSQAWSSYAGCADADPTPGKEIVYLLRVTAPTRLRAFLLHQPVHGTRLFLLGSSETNTGCLASSLGMIATTLPPGTYRLVVDTLAEYARTGSEYALAVVECDPSDRRCD